MFIHELSIQFIQMNIWKIIYLNCGERYEFMIDHRSYINNLGSCIIRAWKNSGLNGILCSTIWVIKLSGLFCLLDFMTNENSLLLKGCHVPFGKSIIKSYRTYHKNDIETSVLVLLCLKTLDDVPELTQPRSKPWNKITVWELMLK